MRLIPESDQVNRQNRQKALEALVQLEGKFMYYAENELGLRISSKAAQKIGDLAHDLWKDMQKRNAIELRTVDMSSYRKAIQDIVESHSSTSTQYYR